MGQSKPAASQSISFAVVTTVASRNIQALTAQLGPHDEILVCHAEEMRESEITPPSALARAANPWVVALHAYESISPDVLANLRSALDQAETSHYQVPVQMPHAAGQPAWSRAERRIFARDYRGHRLSLAKSISIESPPMLRADATLALNHRLCSALEWVEREPESAVAWVNLAGSYCIQRNWVKAEGAARHAVLRAVGSEALDASQMHSLALLRQGKHRQVLENARTEKQMGIRNLLSTYWQAQAHEAMGNIAHALEVMDDCCERSWDCALTGDPAIARVHRWVDRAHLLVLHRRHEEALAEIARLDEKDRSTARPSLVAARACSGLGDYSEALNLLTPWLRGGETEGEIARLAADLFAAIGQYREAADYYAAAWHQGAGDEDLYTRWLHVAEIIGDTARVEAAYSACAHATEVNTDLLLSWAKNFERAGELEKANSCYREALARNPHDPDLYFALGRLLARTGNPMDAVHLFDAGLRLAPNNTEAAMQHQEALAMAGLQPPSPRAA